MSTQAIATAKEVFDLLRDDLSAIEKELVRDAVSNVGAITDIADHLREGGGKRIRPSLLLLAAKSNFRHPDRRLGVIFRSHGRAFKRRRRGPLFLLRGFDNGTRWKSHARSAGTATTMELEISKDNVLFGVRAVDASGHRSLAVPPVPGRG